MCAGYNTDTPIMYYALMMPTYNFLFVLYEAERTLLLLLYFRDSFKLIQVSHYSNNIYTIQ